jgi:hypothetical protein
MAYIGNFPTAPGFQAVKFAMNNTVKQTATASGRIIRSTNATTLWSGTLQFPPMTLAEFLPIKAFLARCQGGLNEFDVTIPTVSQSSKGYSNDSTVSLTVTSAASAGATSISVNSILNSTTILNPGDVIRFANHTKVYMVTDSEGVTTDGSGNATINFEPALVTAVDARDSTGGPLIQMGEVPFRMILTNEVQEMQYRTDGLIQYELDVIEVI